MTKADNQDAAERISKLTAALRAVWDAHKDAIDDADEFQADFMERFATIIDDTLPEAASFYEGQAERCGSRDSDRAYDMRRAAQDVGASA